MDKLGQVDVDKVAKAYEERNNETDTMLSDLQDWIDEADRKFSDWEIDFINSITDWRENDRDITIPQFEKLLSLYTKRL